MSTNYKTISTLARVGIETWNHTNISWQSSCEVGLKKKNKVPPPGKTVKELNIDRSLSKLKPNHAGCLISSLSSFQNTSTDVIKTG